MLPSDTDAVRIAVIGLKDSPGVAFKLFDTLANKNINVDMILQSIGRAMGRRIFPLPWLSTDLEETMATLEKQPGALGYKELHGRRKTLQSFLL